MLNPSSFLRRVTWAFQFCAFSQGLTISWGGFVRLDLMILQVCSDQMILWFMLVPTIWNVFFLSYGWWGQSGWGPQGPCSGIDDFDHSFYICNRGCWITPGNSSSEPLTGGQLLCIFRKHPMISSEFVCWWAAQVFICDLFPASGTISSLSLPFVTAGVSCVWRLLAWRKPGSASATCVFAVGRHSLISHRKRLWVTRVTLTCLPCSRSLFP